MSDDHFDLKICLENAYTPHEINTQFDIVTSDKYNHFRFVLRRTYYIKCARSSSMYRRESSNTGVTYWNLAVYRKISK